MKPRPSHIPTGIAFAVATIAIPLLALIRWILSIFGVAFL